MEVTYDDVETDLVIPARLQADVDAWKRKRGPVISRWVLGFRHRALFNVRPLQVKRTMDEGQHALGEVNKRENYAQIADGHVPWAMEYLFHGLFERDGKMPSWSAFVECMTGSHSRFWYDPMVRSAMEGGLTAQKAGRAVQWRLGNFYYSAVRETFMLACLRHDHGTPAKYHLLTDVLFKADAWHGMKLVYLRVPNKYEERKQGPEARFARHGFLVQRVEIPRQGFGKVWLAPGDNYAAVARFFR